MCTIGIVQSLKAYKISLGFTVPLRYFIVPLQSRASAETFPERQRKKKTENSKKTTKNSTIKPLPGGGR